MSALTQTGDPVNSYRAVEAWLYQAPYWWFSIQTKQDKPGLLDRCHEIFKIYRSLKPREQRLVHLRYWTTPQPSPEQMARELGVSMGVLAALKNSVVYTFQARL